MSKRRDGGAGKSSFGTGSVGRRSTPPRGTGAGGPPGRGHGSPAARGGVPEWAHKRAGGRTPMGAKGSDARPVWRDGQQGAGRDSSTRRGQGERRPPKSGRGGTPAGLQERGGWADRPIREAGVGARSQPSSAGRAVRATVGAPRRYAPVAGAAAVHKSSRNRDDNRGLRDRSVHGAAPDREERHPTGREEIDIQAEFVAGRRAVLEALRSERALNKLLVQDDVSGGSIGELLAIARTKGVVIQRVPRARLDEIAQGRGHQGVLAYTAAHPYADLEELIDSVPKSKPGLLVVLDGIED
ncbi:MAG: hypothetical protein OWT27_06830, partial [Firmicutes bacterium]|nr:hypothetical protein [Bacillota bacterium]